MFTGIVEGMGKVVATTPDQDNLHISMTCDFTQELRVDQSIAHNGVCLTVTTINGGTYDVTAIRETLDNTNLGSLKPGAPVNLERCMKIGDRLDGHIVQGHVDGTAACTKITDEGGSTSFEFEMDHDPEVPFIHKGSVTINGVSLTLTLAEGRKFAVAIIPYTLEHTTFKYLDIGDRVNIEFDVIGKYVQQIMARR